eukprot:TRINITY_DN2524_c0_g1_i2.p2 TRINITY_DN2524_c0_g1~~TRINITY_DN2524_c0_g1_i2.p2  ORF type:complete len:182 (-),score=22.82 TRINITY_DN2524_c0_g1_i2:105-650(-)
MFKTSTKTKSEEIWKDLLTLKPVFKLISDTKPLVIPFRLINPESGEDWDNMLQMIFRDLIGQVRHIEYRQNYLPNSHNIRIDHSCYKNITVDNPRSVTKYYKSRFRRELLECEERYKCKPYEEIVVKPDASNSRKSYSCECEGMPLIRRLFPHAKDWSDFLYIGTYYFGERILPAMKEAIK